MLKPFSAHELHSRYSESEDCRVLPNSFRILVDLEDWKDEKYTFINPLTSAARATPTPHASLLVKW